MERTEDTITVRLKSIQEQLDAGLEGMRFLSSALSAYRDACLREAQLSMDPVLAWLARMQKDKELRHPHRKILARLLDEFDFLEGQFQEIHFSKLVKEAHVGKNAARSYLSLLETKGYISARNDGYRKFLRMRG